MAEYFFPWVSPQKPVVLEDSLQAPSLQGLGIVDLVKARVKGCTSGDDAHEQRLPNVLKHFMISGFKVWAALPTRAERGFNHENSGDAYSGGAGGDYQCNFLTRVYGSRRHFRGWLRGKATGS